MTADLRRGFRLGEYRVQPLQGTLTGPGGSRHLQPKVVEVLLCLANTPGEIVEREHLLEKVWGRSAVSDEVLTRCISELRHALDDQRGAPRYIQTVPKRGYRLIAPVGETGETPGTQLAAGDPVAAGPPAARIGIARFIHELARRRVLRAAAAYLIAAWVTIEVSATVLPALDLPGWTVKLVIVLLALGFPVAMVMAWFFNLTPEGLERDGSAVAGEHDTPAQRRVDYVLLAAMVLIAGVIVYRSVTMDTGEKPPPPIEDTQFQSTIAVLPFKAIGADPVDEDFGDGLATELVMSFSRLPELKVAARASSFSFKDKAVDVPTIADRLQVAAVLDGNVRRIGDMLRISVQLADAEGFNVWTETYDRRPEETLAVQLDITRRVVAAIVDKLSAESEASLEREPTQSSAAYEAYLRGRNELRRPKETATLARAVDNFDQAIELDPRYAAAFAGLCDAHLAQYVLSKDTDFFEEAEKACHRALTLDRSLVEARLALGSLYRHSGQYENALTELEAVVSSNPGIVQAYDELGATFAGLNRMNDAEAAYRQAVAMEPSYWAVHKSLGNFLYRSGRYEKAEKSYETVIEIASDNPSAYNNLGAARYMLGDFPGAVSAWEDALVLAPTRSAYLNLGVMYFYTGRFTDSVAMYEKAAELEPADFRLWSRIGVSLRHVPGEEVRSSHAFDECIRLGEEVLEVNPDHIDALRVLSVCYTRVGRVRDGQTSLEHLLALQSEDPDVYFVAAVVYAAISDHDAALEFLEKALSMGYSLHIVQAEPDLAELRPLASFQRLLARHATD